MYTKLYTLIYTPACCPRMLKGENCPHEKHELAYHCETIKEAIESQGRVGGIIYTNADGQLIPYILG